MYVSSGLTLGPGGPTLDSGGPTLGPKGPFLAFGTHSRPQRTIPGPKGHILGILNIPVGILQVWVSPVGLGRHW